MEGVTLTSAAAAYAAARRPGGRSASTCPASGASSRRRCSSQLAMPCRGGLARLRCAFTAVVGGRATDPPGAMIVCPSIAREPVVDAPRLEATGGDDRVPEHSSRAGGRCPSVGSLLRRKGRRGMLPLDQRSGSCMLGGFYFSSTRKPICFLRLGKPLCVFYFRALLTYERKLLS